MTVLKKKECGEGFTDADGLPFPVVRLPKRGCANEEDSQLVFDTLCVRVDYKDDAANTIFLTVRFFLVLVNNRNLSVNRLKQLPSGKDTEVWD
jgi:hypothetical protein